MKYVYLWEFKNDNWKYLGIKMPLDITSPIAQTWGNSIRDGEVYAFAEGSNDPKKFKPTTVPEEILNLISPSQGIRERDARARKIFQGSSQFFIDKTEEIIKPKKISKSKFIPNEGTRIYELLDSLKGGVELSKTGFSNKQDLADYLGKLGYTIKLRGGLFYLC